MFINFSLEIYRVNMYIVEQKKTQLCCQHHTANFEFVRKEIEVGQPYDCST